jgi:hypothetical protein
MPESLRQCQGVAERYAVLDRPPQLRDSTRALATSGWTFVFVAFFTVLAATDFSVGFVLVLAAAFSLLWGGTEYSRRRREEDAFLAAITRQQPRGHNRVTPATCSSTWSIGSDGWRQRRSPARSSPRP